MHYSKTVDFDLKYLRGHTWTAAAHHCSLLGRSVGGGFDAFDGPSGVVMLSGGKIPRTRNFDKS